MRPFGIYSEKLNSLAVEDINQHWDTALVAGYTKRLVIYYLIKDRNKDIVREIDPERDIKAYSRFDTTSVDGGIMSDAVEGTWRSRWPAGPLLGVGHARVYDARGIRKFAAKINREGTHSAGEAGKVIIMSKPSRCKVSFLGYDVEKTIDQIVLEGVPTGVHAIMFKLGRKKLRAEIEVKSDCPLEVTGNFERREIQIHKIISEPKEADKIGNDGAPMVLIPAGEFQMGSIYRDEQPIHTVYVDAFHMDIYEVTNAQYRKFMDATGHKAPESWKDINYNAPNQPVIGVSWEDAVAYCRWAGKRLPTEAEWEKAARGGLVGKKYTWGNSVTAENANCYNLYGKKRHRYPSPVGSFPPNGYGLYDMAGNASEWCSDFYSEDYYSISPSQNPEGPDSGRKRVRRGSPSSGYTLRVAWRGKEDSESGIAGFRCAASRSD